MPQYRTIAFKNIRKEFPGVLALDDVSFSVHGGRVCALLGENGAGKSTLLRILSGDLWPDSGEILIDGKPCRFSSPRDALKTGISVIYQERQLVPGMSVMENVFIDDLPVKGIRVDKATLRKKTRAILDAFGLALDPEETVGRLSVGHQQMIEIMKAYRRDSQIIAFDEPTAPLTNTEIDVLFKIIAQLKAMGKIILYISHRLQEIFRVTDEIVVLKDGKLVRELQTAQSDEKELITAMVGRDIGDTYANLRRNETVGEILLDVKNLVTDSLHGVSFTLRRGEILGFAGLVGSGRTEVARALFGADPVHSGEIMLDGRPVRFRSPKNALAAGIALCPEDRKEEGLFLGRSIRDNLTSAVLSKMKQGLFLNHKLEKAFSDKTMKKYAIKAPSAEKIVYELSGGNQQKVVLGRFSSGITPIKLLMLDEPTKGIDIGTKAEIYQTICDYARTGIAVILISSELTEVINLSDRIIVMRNGGINGILPRRDATEERVLALAMSDTHNEHN